MVEGLGFRPGPLVLTVLLVRGPRGQDQMYDHSGNMSQKHPKAIRIRVVFRGITYFLTLPVDPKERRKRTKLTTAQAAYELQGALSLWSLLKASGCTKPKDLRTHMLRRGLLNRGKDQRSHWLGRKIHQTITLAALLLTSISTSSLLRMHL